MKSRLFVIGIAAATVVSSCGSSDNATAGAGGPSVVASFYPLAFVAERVAGDHAAVENLTQPGVESHDLELTGRQVGQLADADLVLYLRGFQPAVDDAVEQNAGAASLDVAELVDLGDVEHEHDNGHDEHEVEGDPHVWLNPANMLAITSAVTEQLSEVDPDHAADYQRNADALAADLDALDNEYTAGLEQCERNVIVVAHEAFGHLADRYGLEQVGIAGIDPDAEPSPERVADVHDIVAAEGITTIFYERLVAPEVAQRLAEDVGVETAVLDPIEGLTDDTADEDYLSLMRANLAAMREANGCD